MDAPIGKNTKRILADSKLTKKLMEILISRDEIKDNYVLKIDGKDVEYTSNVVASKNGSDSK